MITTIIMDTWLWGIPESSIIGREGKWDILTALKIAGRQQEMQESEKSYDGNIQERRFHNCTLPAFLFILTDFNGLRQWIFNCPCPLPYCFVPWGCEMSPWLGESIQQVYRYNLIYKELHPGKHIESWKYSKSKMNLIHVTYLT